MRCPTLNELPPHPPGKTGWPFDTAQDRPWTEGGLIRLELVKPEVYLWLMVGLMRRVKMPYLQECLGDRLEDDV
jgi:hypothetical protein